MLYQSTNLVSTVTCVPPVQTKIIELFNYTWSDNNLQIKKQKYYYQVSCLQLVVTLTLVWQLLHLQHDFFGLIAVWHGLLTG